MNYSQIMSPRSPLPRKVGGGHDPPAPMGAPPLVRAESLRAGSENMSNFVTSSAVTSQEPPRVKVSRTFVNLGRNIRWPFKKNK